MSKIRSQSRIELKFVILAVVLFATTGIANGQKNTPQSADLSTRGVALVKKYCVDCHGTTFNGSSRFDLNNIPALTKSDANEDAYIVPGQPEESLMWQRIASDEMPPEDSPQPTEEQRETLRRWIASGAPVPPSREVAAKDESTIVNEMLRDLDNFDERDLPFIRYFTLHNIAAQTRISDSDLRMYQAALSKTINSLSLKPNIILPMVVNDDSTLFRIDLRDLGWDSNNMWRVLLKQYPYGLTFDKITHDDQLRRRSARLSKQTGSKIPYVRADWFVVNATQGSLYNDFLRIPTTVQELEHRLGLDTKAAFVADPPQVARAGFDESGVSIGARVLNRYDLPHGGYFWSSDDFVKSNRRSTLYRFALGPVFEENEFAERFGYQHDGGEIIFSLPNGMQGYMLVDGQGNRIEKGPIEVVRDSKEIGGTPEVVNAISCIHCHQHGMIGFQDSVRQSLGIQGRALEKAKQLYLSDDQMQAKVASDKKRFLIALKESMGPFLLVGNNTEKPIESFIEPVGVVAKNYGRDITLSDAAAELGIPAEALKTEIQTNDQLQFLGLGPLAIDRKINRAAWDSIQFKFSLFQMTAQELKLGSMYLEY